MRTLRCSTIRARAWLLGALVVIGCATPPPAPPSPPPSSPGPASPPPVAEDLPAAAVASDCAPAAQAAIAILERGGSAADAAIAGLLAAGVAAPAASGLGGGGVALVADASGAVAVIDFRPRAPTNADPSAVERARLARDEGDRAALVAVPGEVAGLALLHRHAGRLPFAILFEPAIALAREGFVADPHLARAVAEARPWLAQSALATLLPGGEAIAPGATAPPRPELAATLEAIAAGGEAAFYEGPIAEALVAAGLARGDLAAYHATLETPVVTALGDLEVVAPPTQGGLVLAETLSLFEPPLPPGDAAALDRFVAALRTARRDVVQNARALDPAALLAPARLEGLRPAQAPLPLAPGGTTSILVVRGDEVVGVSSSLGDPFGARIVTAGLVLNDHLAAFARPHEVRRFGAAPVAAGVAAPTSLAPVLVRRAGRIVLALTGSGGEHVPGSLAQVLIALAGGSDPADAVAAHRLRAPAEGGLWLEPGEEALASALRRAGHHVRTDLPGLDAIQIVARHPRLEAFVDPRKGGATAVRR